MKDPFIPYFHLMRKIKYLILILWIGMVGFGVWYAPKLFNRLKVRQNAAPPQQSLKVHVFVPAGRPVAFSVLAQCAG